MFSSPQLKDPIILDPGKIVTQYQSTLFSDGVKQKLSISQVIGKTGKFNMSLVIFGAILFLTLNISVTRTCRFLTWILTTLSFSRSFSKFIPVYNP